MNFIHTNHLKFKKSQKLITLENYLKILKKLYKIYLKQKKEGKKKENENVLNELSINSDKFLIIDENRKSVKRNTRQIKPINLSEIDNQSIAVDTIEIEEIKPPEKYSINSIMEYFGKCILTTQILPSFIRYAVKNQNPDNIKKATNILSDLYNLYKSLENHNFSIISSRTKEYQKSFEIMFSKLKKAKVDFSKDTELKKLKCSNDNQIQNIIILPEKDKFTIARNNFETDDPNEQLSSNNFTSSKTSRIMFNKTGIKSIQDSQVMNLEYESLRKRESEIKITQKNEKKSEVK